MSASVPAVHDASISALKDLNLPIIEDNNDKLSAKIKSKFADGSDVWIEIDTQDGGIGVRGIYLRAGITSP